MTKERRKSKKYNTADENMRRPKMVSFKKLNSTGSIDSLPSHSLIHHTERNVQNKDKVSSVASVLSPILSDIFPLKKFEKDNHIKGKNKQTKKDEEQQDRTNTISEEVATKHKKHKAKSKDLQENTEDKDEEAKNLSGRERSSSIGKENKDKKEKKKKTKKDKTEKDAKGEEKKKKKKEQKGEKDTSEKKEKENEKKSKKKRSKNSSTSLEKEKKKRPKKSKKNRKRFHSVQVGDKDIELTLGKPTMFSSSDTLIPSSRKTTRKSDEIWRIVFSYLDVKSLISASIVCKQFHMLASCDALWKAHFDKDFLISAVKHNYKWTNLFNFNGLYDINVVRHLGGKTGTNSDSDTEDNFDTRIEDHTDDTLFDAVICVDLIDSLQEMNTSKKQNNVQYVWKNKYKELIGDIKIQRLLLKHTTRVMDGKNTIRGRSGKKQSKRKSLIVMNLSGSGGILSTKDKIRRSGSELTESSSSSSLSALANFSMSFYCPYKFR